MWVIASYQPVALFSLKPATATSSGGKTLLCPTPFAIKMALLSAAIHTQTLDDGKALWPRIRDLEVGIRLPHRLSVIHTFTKIVRPKKNGPSDDTGAGLVTPLGSTIAYREYVSYSGAIQIALRSADGNVDQITPFLRHIAYLGKRGGFMQLLDHPVNQETIPDDAGWIMATRTQEWFSLNGTLQMLDDCASSMQFDHANIYHSKRITLGKERILRHVVLPYALVRSSRAFSLYEQVA